MVEGGLLPVRSRRLDVTSFSSWMFLNAQECLEGGKCLGTLGLKTLHSF